MHFSRLSASPSRRALRCDARTPHITLAAIVNPSHYGLSSSQHNADLTEFLTGPFNPNMNFAYFILNGSGHVLLPGAPSDSTAGVNLEQFIGDMVTNDPGWTSVHP